jgi:hypothetical protein
MALTDPETSSAQGEVLSLSERIVVSPGWGRIRLGELAGGALLGAQTVIGEVRQSTLPGAEIVVLGPAEFVCWLVLDKEPVRPGTAVARVRPIA